MALISPRMTKQGVEATYWKIFWQHEDNKIIIKLRGYLNQEIRSLGIDNFIADFPIVYEVPIFQLPKNEWLEIELYKYIKSQPSWEKAEDA